MSYRSRGSAGEPKSFFGGTLNWLTLFTFAMLVGLAVFALLSGSRQPPFVLDSSNLGGGINAQIIGSTNPVTGVSLTFPAISQRDKRQYSSEAEWKEWSPSACAPAVMVSVLNGYGKQVKISEVLGLMRDQGAISTSQGLFKYGVFSSIASKYGLRTDYSESKDLNRHFDSVIAAVQKGSPVIMNIQDATYFPNGHFIVAVRVNLNETVSVINPDPERGKSVALEWPTATLKTYFSRSLRSAIFSSGQS
ncbi:MAG: C39 family peptidase [Chloroflexota bacterium]|nr:C39 family peptidase [Chloroflexota bacterium]